MARSFENATTAPEKKPNVGGAPGQCLVPAQRERVSSPVAPAASAWNSCRCQLLLFPQRPKVFFNSPSKSPRLGVADESRMARIGDGLANQVNPSIGV